MNTSNVQFKCQKHQYHKFVRKCDINRTKCPLCQQQKKDIEIIGKKCKQCGKEMIKWYGCGEYCDSVCSHARSHTTETKKKISESVKKLFKPLVKNCKVCGKQFDRRRRITCSQSCQKSLRKEIVNSKQYKNKMFEVQKKRLLMGLHKGWNSRNIVSYPQKFFITVLTNNKIQYIHQYKVLQHDLDQSLKNCYFMDFYLPQYNVDLEIDGKQHINQDRVQSDKKRDQLLSKKYKVYRIAWNCINSQSGKILMKQKIQKFLQYLK